MGADAYLIKPFEPEDLIIAIQARLKRIREMKAKVRELPAFAVTQA